MDSAAFRAELAAAKEVRNHYRKLKHPHTQHVWVAQKCCRATAHVP